MVERLRENLADFNENFFKTLYQDRLDIPITGHVLVQISRFLKSFSAKSAKFSRTSSKGGFIFDQVSILLGLDPIASSVAGARSYTPHPTPYTLHPTPYTLHPTPYTLHPTPYTLNRTPYTLHPTPYTLHPTPYTLHSKP